MKLTPEQVEKLERQATAAHERHQRYLEVDIDADTILTLYREWQEMRVELAARQPRVQVTPDYVGDQPTLRDEVGMLRKAWKGGDRE